MDIKRKLEEYITAETNDSALYLKIAAAISEQFKEDFIKIAEDEKQHAFAFLGIYKDMFNINFGPKISDVKIGNIVELLFERIDGEKNDYKKYDKDSCNGNNSLMLRYAFHRASADENTHALTILKVLNGLLRADKVAGSQIEDSPLAGSGEENDWLKSECQKDFDLMSDMRKVWSQHVWWTRNAIISILNDLPDTEAVTAELMKNPKNIGDIFGNFCGKETGDAVTKLITEHLSLGGEIFKAIKARDHNKVLSLETKWYQNADEIAKALASLNKNYDENELREMLYDHLAMTTNQAAYMKSGEYEKSIMEFNSIEDEILKMADYLSLGIIQ